MTFGKRIRLILEFKNLEHKEYTQRVFARDVGISESQLSKLLHNKKKPTIKELRSMIDVLHIPYECLIGDVPLFDDLLKMRSLWR